ncbi:caspase, EACC1-associated type [Streptomyces umbrinus]
MDTREALLIGTSVYDDPAFGALNAPARDVAALAEVLSAKDIGGYTVKPPLIDADADTLRRSVEAFFVRRRALDELLLYISCHGVTDDDGQLYFVATDTAHDFDTLRSASMPAGFLRGCIGRCQARRIVVLLDCCFSGAFIPGMKGGAGVDLPRQLRGTGTAVLTASSGLQRARDGDVLGGQYLSVFTQFVVEGLQSGQADVNGDGWVSPEDLYLYLNDRCIGAGSGQIPNHWMIGGDGSLRIARRASGAPAPSLVSAIPDLPPDRQSGNLADILPARSLRAYFVGESGDAAQAVDLYTELLPELVRELGEDASETLRARGRQARFLRLSGDFETAVSCYVPLLADLKRIEGRDSADTLSVRSDYADALGAMGDPEAALAQYARLLPDFPASGPGRHAR